MRPMPNETLEKIRNVAHELEFCGATGAGSGDGCFQTRYRGEPLRIIASCGDDWEHVSVSVRSARCPTWGEMRFVKGLFWLPEEAVMQLHPPESDYVNNDPYCLHLWKPTSAALPLPPAIYVGVRDEGPIRSPEHARAIRERARSA